MEQKVQDRTAELKDINSRLVREIAERTHVEEALRESEQRFRTMADSAPVLIWIAGPDKQFSYFNKTWLNYTGRPLEKEIGMGWLEGVHPEDQERCKEVYIQAFDAHQEFKMEYRLRYN